MMGSWVWRYLALVITFGLLMAGAALAADKMVLGTGVDPTLSQFYVGVEAGIFKKHNLDVEVKLFGTASASTPSLIPGDIQASLTSAPAGALAHAKAPKVVLVAQTNLFKDYYGAVAESTIKDVPALRGQKLGVAMGSTSETIAIDVLARFGMTLKDVLVVNVEPPEMLAALQRKDIGAYFVWEPWISRAKFALGERVHVLPGSTDVIGQNNLAMDREWIEKNPDTALRFLRAVKEAGEFIRSHPKESAQMVAKFLKLDVKLVEVLLPKSQFPFVLNDGSITFLKSEVDKLIATNRLKAPFDYKGYVYPDLLRKIDPSLVDYRLPN
jgi:ABC-type nitrate/sulfonate/bicarbonate transport system substrate-binding protein